MPTWPSSVALTANDEISKLPSLVGVDVLPIRAVVFRLRSLTAIANPTPMWFPVTAPR